MLRAGLLLMSVGLAGCASIIGIEDTVYEPTDSCVLQTSRIFFADKVVDATTITIGMVTQARLGEIATVLGTTIDPSRGHVVATIADCGDGRVEDAALSLEPPDDTATMFVVANEGPSLGEDSSALGIVGALNLTAPREVALEAYPAELGDDASSTGDVQVAAGEVGYIFLRPSSDTPAPTTPAPVGPPDFTCVGTVAPPMTTAATTTITIDVRLSQTLAPLGQPLEGVRVRVCRDAFEACAIDLSQPVDPVNEAVTDATGRATLVVSTPSDGFDGTVLAAGIVPGCM